MAEETRKLSLEENFARLEELIGELERDDMSCFYRVCNRFPL